MFLRSRFLLLTVPATLFAQYVVPPALKAPPARPPQTGSQGEKLIGMPKFHEPAPYDINEHTGYKQIFDGKTFAGWDADSTIWRVENGLMIGETLAVEDLLVAGMFVDVIRGGIVELRHADQLLAL